MTQEESWFHFSYCYMFGDFGDRTPEYPGTDCGMDVLIYAKSKNLAIEWGLKVLAHYFEKRYEFDQSGAPSKEEIEKDIEKELSFCIIEECGPDKEGVEYKVKYGEYSVFIEPWK